jgi:hypothetical protein
MASYLYWRSGFTGGSADDLDGISGANVTAGDVCLVLDATNKKLAFFVLEDPIGVAESSPNVIIPDVTPSTKGWRRYRTVSSMLFEDSADTPATAPTVSGDKAICIGDACDVDGDYAAVLSGKTNTIVVTAGQSSDSAVIAGGESNDITNGDYGVICGGYDNSITGDWCAVIGGGQGNLASGDYTVIGGGLSAVAHLEGMRAHANGAFVADGGAQWGDFKLRNTTTNATETELFLNGTAGRPVLPASRLWAFSIKLAARQASGAAGTAGDSAFWNITGGIKRDGSNATVLVGTPQGTGVPGANDRDAAAAAWSVAVTADNTNESLCVKVTGEVDKNIYWSATVTLEAVG